MRRRPTAEFVAVAILDVALVVISITVWSGKAREAGLFAAMLVGFLAICTIWSGGAIYAGRRYKYTLKSEQPTCDVGHIAIERGEFLRIWMLVSWHGLSPRRIWVAVHAAGEADPLGTFVLGESEFPGRRDHRNWRKKSVVRLAPGEYVLRAEVLAPRTDETVVLYWEKSFAVREALRRRLRAAD